MSKENCNFQGEEKCKKLLEKETEGGVMRDGEKSHYGKRDDE